MRMNMPCWIKHAREQTVKGNFKNKLVALPILVLCIISSAALAAVPDLSWWVSGGAGGWAHVFKGVGNGSALRKPIVIVSGFDLDPRSQPNPSQLYDTFNQLGLADELRSRGYDLIALKFYDSTDYIQRNAEVVTSLLQKVRQDTSGAAKTVVIGASMGGLVSRYALRKMENSKQDHSVGLFISFDAPQKFANIPLGLQYVLNVLWDPKYGNSALAYQFYQRLNTPAARQMLALDSETHHENLHNPQYSLNHQPAAPDWYALRAELAAMGNYPSKPRKVAIANGSGHGQGQGYAPGSELLDIDCSPNPCRISASATTDAKAISPWFFLVGLIYFHDTADYPLLSIDSSPGGRLDTLKWIASSIDSSTPTQVLHENHSFIPTISALDIATTNLYYPIASDTSILAKTPFDAIYYPENGQNEPHLTVSAKTKARLIDEIETTNRKHNNLWLVPILTQILLD